MRYTSQGSQLTIVDFNSPLSDLPKSNRWVQLGDHLPWSLIEQSYNSKLKNQRTGAANKPARMVVGALIVKHKLNLSDEETILAIQENPYMQYMLGLTAFSDKPVFDPTLFVTIRKRLQINDLNEFTAMLLSIERSTVSAKSKDGDSDSNVDSESGSASTSSTEDDTPMNDEIIDDQGRLHKGSMKIDATCSDAEVRYPTDIDLLHDGSRVINRYIDKLCNKFGLPHPVTYHKPCRKEFLTVIKRKKKSRKMLHACKSKTPTEFGAKIGVSVVVGYTFVDHHSWDAYNESIDLEAQVQLYQARFGYLPQSILADQIYLNRDNRRKMKELGIELIGKPLGRPPKEITPETQAKIAKSAGERNEVEATFGTGKRVYRANNIRAKLPQTANCWTGMCYFVKNVMKFLKGLRRRYTFVRKFTLNPTRFYLHEKNNYAFAFSYGFCA